MITDWCTSVHLYSSVTMVSYVEYPIALTLNRISCYTITDCCKQSEPIQTSNIQILIIFSIVESNFYLVFFFQERIHKRCLPRLMYSEGTFTPQLQTFLRFQIATKGKIKSRISENLPQRECLLPSQSEEISFDTLAVNEVMIHYATLCPIVIKKHNQQTSFDLTYFNMFLRAEVHFLQRVQILLCPGTQ